jgi:hypothetical protein
VAVGDEAARSQPGVVELVARRPVAREFAARRQVVVDGWAGHSPNVVALVSHRAVVVALAAVVACRSSVAARRQIVVVVVVVGVARRRVGYTAV